MRLSLRGNDFMKQLQPKVGSLAFLLAPPLKIMEICSLSMKLTVWPLSENLSFGLLPGLD